MKIKIFLLLLIAMFARVSASAQSCPEVTTFQALNITSTSATLTADKGTGGISFKIFVYDSVTNALVYTNTNTTCIWNVSGLLPNNPYTYAITKYCSSGSNTTGSFFRTATATPQNPLTYTPMTAAGYQFKHLKADSSFALPIGDTVVGRAVNRPGLVKILQSDSTAWYYDGFKWKPLGDASASAVNKVDSLSSTDSTIVYWINGTSYEVLNPAISGYTLDAILANGDTTSRSIYFNNLKNNVAEDSVLSTDVDGKLKLKYVTGGGGGSQNLQQVTDIDNRTDNSIYTTDSIRANEGVFNLIAMNGLDRNINNVNEITGTQSNFSIGNVYDSLRLNYIKNNLAGDSILTTTYTTGKIINIHKNSLGFVKISDTSAMLSPYLRKIDTATLSNRIDSIKNVVYGQQYTYDIALTQTRNSINLPYKGHKVSLDSIQLVGAVTGVSYTLYKTVSGVPTAGTTRTTLVDINSDIAALNSGELNATYQILILFTFLAGAEYGGAILFVHKL